MRARDHRALLELLVVGGVVAAGIVAAPALREVFSTAHAGTLRPATLAASKACPPPRAQRQAATQ